MGDFIQIERQGRVAIVRLNKPEALNAIGTLDDCNDIIAALDGLDADPSVSVMVLTGNGRAFCAGGDLKSMKARTGIGPQKVAVDTRNNYRRGVQAVVRAFMRLEVPAIAAVNGHAVGLGMDLACLCDVRISAESALYAASFIKVGIVPGDGGAWSLQKVLGYSKAAELFLTGDRFNAQAALEMGLVSKVVPDADLMDAALELAGRMACNPPRSLRLTKRLLREGQNSRMDDVLELSAAYQALAHETADHVEAVDALLEKRAPNFTGE
ncbi:MAG TPA: crotonase/enoyl-CoA hydratase family protein [Chakrabartia sp.]|jgi:enoyl-CoA hydratase/carnithine racemase|nr:crotonase/enoyl-CoA hydratase family protein [Chakrabartia sp.]